MERDRDTKRDSEREPMWVLTGLVQWGETKMEIGKRHRRGTQRGQRDPSMERQEKLRC